MDEDEIKARIEKEKEREEKIGRDELLKMKEERPGFEIVHDLIFKATPRLFQFFDFGSFSIFSKIATSQSTLNRPENIWGTGGRDYNDRYSIN